MIPKDLKIGDVLVLHFKVLTAPEVNETQLGDAKLTGRVKEIIEFSNNQWEIHFEKRVFTIIDGKAKIHINLGYHEITRIDRI